METAWPVVNQPAITSRFLKKRINTERDVLDFKTKSPAYAEILFYVNLLCDKIHGTSNKILNRKYTLRDEQIQRCARLLDELSIMCDETDLKQAKGSAPLRFGHIAFRGWFDAARERCHEFVFTQLATGEDDQLKEELLSYLSDSFGNKMRIDYGTGHELNFVIFTMGLSYLLDSRPIVDDSANNNHDITLTDESSPMQGKNAGLTNHRLANYVHQHGWDILALFSHKYLRLCRKLQTKFRLEPAGSRGVYNMDDFQYLPFLFGSAQLSGVKYIPIREFHVHENVDMFKDDFIFIEAVDYILNNKRGPFNEHSYTLWSMSVDLGSWENIYRRIKTKFTDDILEPFPIVQHLLFGRYILRWC